MCRAESQLIRSTESTNPSSDQLLSARQSRRAAGRRANQTSSNQKALTKVIVGQDGYHAPPSISPGGSLSRSAAISMGRLVSISLILALTVTMSCAFTAPLSTDVGPHLHAPEGGGFQASNNPAKRAVNFHEPDYIMSATKTKTLSSVRRLRTNRSPESNSTTRANRDELEYLVPSADLELLRNPKTAIENRSSLTGGQRASEPQLTFRQATSAPASGGNSSTPYLHGASSEGQWIPIRGQSRARPSPVVHVEPQQATTRRPHYSQRQQQAQQAPATRRAPANQANGLTSVESRRNQQRRRPTQGFSALADGSGYTRAGNRVYGPPLSLYGQQMRRRPRLKLVPEEYEIRATRMYKRVLLCDKTLVSLDYVRNLDLEPRPYGPSYETSGEFHTEHLHDDDDNFADNFINLDSSIDETLLPNRRSANSSSPKSAESVSSAGNTLEPIGAAASFERRHSMAYLSDEDPLVKCDMWDLEKGLKNRKPPENILRMAVKADFDTVRDAINRCRQLSERTLPPEDEYRDQGIEVMSTEDLISLFSMKRGLIPGTKWCGLGDQASHYNDLGPKHRIDICCRAHDHCPIRLKPFRNDYGVLNIALYTKSHCDCDADFYRCLREVRSRTADMLGNLYFNVMKLQCMREERMKVCREMKPIALGFERCVRYEESPIKTVFKFTTPPVAY